LTEFRLQNPKQPFDSCGAEGSKAPARGPPQTHRVGAKRDRFDNIAPSPEATVDEDRNPVANSVHDLGQDFER